MPWSGCGTGQFGICEGCGTGIPMARLNALPYATYCIKCQREAERQGAGGVGRRRLEPLAGFVRRRCRPVDQRHRVGRFLSRATGVAIVRGGRRPSSEGPSGEHVAAFSDVAGSVLALAGLLVRSSCCAPATCAAAQTVRPPCPDPVDVAPSSGPQLQRTLEQNAPVLEAQATVVKTVAKLIGPTVVHIEADVPQQTACSTATAAMSRKPAPA